MKNNNIIITSPIFYPNGSLHIGSAHTLILTRFLKKINEISGKTCQILVGVDENSNKVVKHVSELNQNQAKPITVTDYLNAYEIKFKKLLEKLLINNADYFIRTTRKSHHQLVQSYWIQLLEKGFIEKGYYEGWYSIKDESFIGSDDVIDGHSKDGEKLEFIAQPCYYLMLNKIENKVLDFINQDRLYPGKIKELLKAFMKQGLKKLCISRKRTKDSIGIPVPNDNDYTIYVWFDALLNYISVDNWDESRIIHIVGKDIAQFHGVFWPGILMANDHKTFDKLVVHNWLITSGNKKLSKSSKNSTNPIELIDRYGSEAVIFYSIKNNLIPDDRIFEEEEIVRDYNTFLVNKYSNLVYRVWSVTHKNGLKHQGLKKKYDEEAIISEFAYNGEIDKVINTMIDWVQRLNAKFDHQRLWEKPSECQILMDEIVVLSKYWLAPFNKTINFQDKPIKIFEKQEINIDNN